MAVDQRNVQQILDRVFARQDMEEACRRQDLGAILRICNHHGISQGQLANLIGTYQGRISEYIKGKRSPSAKSTFERVADGLGLPLHLRRALGLAPDGGPGAAKRTDGLIPVADTFDLQLLAKEIGRRGNSVKRRDMLAMVAQIGTTTAIAQSEVLDRLTYAIAKPNAMDETIVREMEARSTGFHLLEEVMPARSLIKGLTAHLGEVGTLLNGTAYDPDNELRTRLIVVAGESSVLTGWAASDIGDATTARNLYATAEKAAREAGDLGIAACAMGYRSYIPSTKGAHGRARALLARALELVSTTTSPGTVSWLAARHAEESAALGDTVSALNSWGRADEAFSIADPEEDRVWTRFLDQNRFDSYRITTFSRLGKLDEAQETASAVLARLTQPDRKKAAIILEGIAGAHLSRGSVGEAAKIAKDGLAVVRETEFAMWLPRFERIANGLRRWPRQPAVRAFLEDLAITKRQFISSPR
ncbi:hypothetical protein SAMN05421505_10659 [Sinosporangium album]|uniref:HTH cro/C1-type domain-containing protein n=1 Tax=Sinosporangium album TaxID=504805 RepID=A0A1G7VX74_9ACTN|nr:helix-turn-helix transcriptional regulator [Sinosporangium album]SDG63480.1 hypothetical protein SAMN05421505_10659 [Sinosporangium album]